MMTLTPEGLGEGEISMMYICLYVNEIHYATKTEVKYCRFFCIVLNGWPFSEIVKPFDNEFYIIIIEILYSTKYYLYP